MTIGIIVAMDKERDLVVSRLQHIDERVEHQQTFTDGRMGQHRIVLLQCGIGKVAAAVGAVELIRRYQAQLQLYAKAIGRGMKLPVKERVIYSFCLEETILL